MDPTVGEPAVFKHKIQFPHIIVGNGINSIPDYNVLRRCVIERAVCSVCWRPADTKTLIWCVLCVGRSNLTLAVKRVESEQKQADSLKWQATKTLEIEPAN